MRFSRHLLLPLLAGLTYLFLYLPVLVLILFSFKPAGAITNLLPVTGWTLAAYSDLWGNPELLIALRNSLIVAGSTVCLSVSLGVMLVWGLFQRLGRYFALFYLTVLVPEVMIAVGLLGLFTLFKLHLGFTSLIVGHTLIGLGFVIPLLYTRLCELDYRLIEAAQDLGASKWQTFRSVVLPLLAPAITSAALLVLITSLDDFLISFFCAGASSQTLSLYIFSLIRTGISPEVNALSTIMLLVSTLLVGAFSRLGGREDVA